MKTIDLTSPAAALAYLRSLPSDQAISLPGANETNTNEGDAVRAITGQSANEWAARYNRWEWTAGELVFQLVDEQREGFLATWSEEVGLSDAEAHWAAFSHQLADSERREIEEGGRAKALEMANEFKALYA